MKNDNSHNDNWGHLPGESVFWTNGQLTYSRHCEGVFTLSHNGVQVMPPATFEAVDTYAKAEFDVMGDWENRDAD